jgi:serine/threonine protein kinase
MITHDRWQRIKNIFYAAQDRAPAERSAFLNEACGDDPSIREEVDALLTADAGNEDFLSSPAYEFAAGMLATEVIEFTAGEKVGRYEIKCPLGAGGMGQIYLAYDPQLGRKIALKLISQEFATDPRRVHRFEQEARAASALNHPNVCVIHEVGNTDQGRHFIAMEYIQGITLRDQLARGPFKPIEALQVIIQVGAALASAHAIGIVHRDIKPENIMLRPDGYVKVVDFGLAKLTELLPEQRDIEDANTNVRTERHTVMGTVKYMSPEQLRETEVDERTDIWSLGVVLYEMLTGSTPFEGRSPNDSIARILGTQEFEFKFPAGIPARLQQCIEKALEKDRDERYQTITKLTADLNSLKRELERNAATGISISIPPAVRKRRANTEGTSTLLTRLRSQAILTADSLRTHKAAAVFGLTSVLAALLLIPTAAKWINRLVNPLQPPSEIKSLTNAGTSVCAAISADGKYVAHAEEQNGKQQLVVTNITNSSSTVAIPPDTVQYLGVTYTHDGGYLYITRKENNGPGILYRLALPGNDLSQVKTGVDSPITFSPNGDRFGFVRHNEDTTEYSLMVSNTDGSNEQLVGSRKDGDMLSLYGAAWSPDGSVIVCPATHWAKGFHTSLVKFDVTTRQEEVIGGQSWFSILQVAWEEDVSSLVISARERETSPHQLWRIHLPDGAAQKLTPDLDEFTGVSISGKNIVSVRTNLLWRIWVSKPEESQKATAVTYGVGLNYGLSWTSQGKIVFSSMHQDRLNISRVDPDGSNPVRLTIVADNYTPAASADGRYIVFSSNRNGPFNIWRMNAEDGSDPVQLTFDDANFYPSVSPDNEWVAYDNLGEAGSSFWKVPLSGGKPIKVGERYRMPVFSPDSQLLACRYNFQSGSRDIAIFSAQGGRPVRRFDIPIQEYQRVYWLNDHELSYVKNVDGYSNVWSYDLNTGDSKQLTNFNSDQIYAYAWSPDFKQIAAQRGTRISDVTMINER